MFVSESLNVNEKGHLTIGGLDTLELAERFGTPVIVYDWDGVRRNCRRFTSSVDRYYGGNGRILYASKAFCCLASCRLANEENMGLDVVSEGEIYTALAAGVAADRLYFHGNNKSPREIEYAVEAGVGAIVCDNPEELETISRVAVRTGKTARLFLRIKPGIDAHTHDFIRTGQIDSKFGFALETGEAMEQVKKTLAAPNTELLGLHCHIGSQVFETRPFVEAAEVMMNFLADIRDETGYTVPQLDLGGGFGIRYTAGDDPIPLDSYMEPVSACIRSVAEARNIPVPFILLEPGRSIVGAEGLTLYTVGSVKEIPNVRTYVGVDGGMGDNPRYILYQAGYTVLNAAHADRSPDAVVTVAGKCCESGDLIQENAPIRSIGAGEVLAVLSTGAYCYSMASNYNRIPRPAVVKVENGEASVIVRRETPAQLIENDV